MIKNRRAFTLLEMIVSIGIISMLIGLFLTNYRGASRGSELGLGAQKTVSDLRLAQNSALGSYRYNGKVPTGGWGVSFDKRAGNNTFYILFADIDADRSHDSPGESIVSYGGNKFDLPANTTISEILFNGISRDYVNVIFLPPDPETIIWDGISTTTNATIILRNDVTGATKSVFVNFFGLIEVQ